MQFHVEQDTRGVRTLHFEHVEAESLEAAIKAVKAGDCEVTDEVFSPEGNSTFEDSHKED